MDLLYCEVICQNMSSLRRSWCILKDLVASNNLGQVDRNGDEVDVDLDVDLDDLGVSTTATCPLKIMAVRDDFVAFRGRPCGRVVVSIDGYLATVMFLEAKLSRRPGGSVDLFIFPRWLQIPKPGSFSTIFRFFSQFLYEPQLQGLMRNWEMFAIWQRRSAYWMM